jgi:hypothetical protein
LHQLFSYPEPCNIHDLFFVDSGIGKLFIKHYYLQLT